MNPFDPLEDFTGADAYSADVNRAVAAAERQRAMNDAACQMIGVVIGLHMQMEVAKLGCLLNANLSAETIDRIFGIPPRHKFILLSGEVRTEPACL